MMEFSEIQFVSLSEIQVEGTKHFKPWTRKMLYEVEPDLERIALEAVSSKDESFPIKLEAYIKAKRTAFDLVGWNAADPRLRSKGAWDCLFDYILSELNI